MSVCRFCVAYVYVDLIERELSEFLTTWNTHKMRKTRSANCPGGIPEDLFYLPHLVGKCYFKHWWCCLTWRILDTPTGAQDYTRRPVNVDVFTEAAQQFCDQKPSFFPTSFSQVADAVLAEQMGITRADITHANCDVVLCTLLSFFN